MFCGLSLLFFFMQMFFFMSPFLQEFFLHVSAWLCAAYSSYMSSVRVAVYCLFLMVSIFANNRTTESRTVFNFQLVHLDDRPMEDMKHAAVDALIIRGRRSGPLLEALAPEEHRGTPQ
jgi:hypothetical protein